MTRHQLAAGSQTFDVQRAVDALLQLVAKAEAFATTVDDLYEEVWNDRRRRHRLAWIVTDAALAAQAALAATDKLVDELIKHREGT